MTIFSDADRERYRTLIEAAWMSPLGVTPPHPGSIDWVEEDRPHFWKGTAAGVVIAGLVLVLVWLFAWPAHAQNQILAIISTSAEATAGGKVICAAPCEVTSLYMTTGATAGYLMTFDSITIPADGAVTARVAGSAPGAASASLVDCVAMPANETRAVSYDTIADVFRVGYTVVFSSTGCYTKTIAATGFFKARKSP